MSGLESSPPGDIKTSPIGYGALQFDWREMRRWGVSESRLPPGSEVLFRPPTAWEQYQWQIIMVAGVSLAQMSLIVGLFYERRRRHHAETASRQRLSELAHMNRTATVGELSATIAHELNQPLGAILSNAEVVEILLDSPSPDIEEVKGIVADIKKDDYRASEVIRSLRRLLTKARPDIMISTSTRPFVRSTNFFRGRRQDTT